MTFAAVIYTEGFLERMAQLQRDRLWNYTLQQFANRNKRENLLSNSSQAQNTNTFSREPIEHQMDGQ